MPDPFIARLNADQGNREQREETRKAELALVAQLAVPARLESALKEQFWQEGVPFLSGTWGQHLTHASLRQLITLS